jgi:hypothetical protein
VSLDKVVSGELALRRLPAVLLDLHDAKASGRLMLRRGRVNKLIDLADGDPISATSSARDETLGHYLASTGVITADVHREAMARAAKDGIRIGEALVAMKVLTPDKLIEQLTNQTRHKLVQALRWSQGAWRFDPSATMGALGGIKLSMVDVVLSGLRDTAAEVDAIRQLDGQEVELTERGKTLLWELYRVFGARTIDAIVVSGKLGEVERAVGDPVRARGAVEALLASGAAVIKALPIGLGAAAPPAPVAAPRTPTPAPVSGGLYDLLFGELNEFDTAPATGTGAAPLEVEEDQDSGVFAVQEMREGVRAYDQTARARKDLLGEHLRVQGLDHYAVLMVDGKASAATIAAAVAERQSKYARDYFARFELGRDTAKLDDIHAAYQAARDTLLDDHARAAYDRELAGGDLGGAVPALASEVAFRSLEEQMARGMWRLALPGLENLVATNPEQPDYLVALGWCVWNAEGRTAHATDLARPHLNQALALAHEHAAGHDYKGRICLAHHAEQPHDSALLTEAMFHLERAVELEPGRHEALELLARTLVRTGEIRRLERLVKRLLYKIANQAPAVEVALWVRLARLQIEHLDDPRAARAALASAQRVAPAAPEVVALSAELEVGQDLDSDTLRAARERWRRHRGDTGAGSALIHAAIRAGQGDAAFLVASAMVALRTADAEAEALYQRDRPRAVKRARVPLDAEQWALLRDPEDSLDLGALIELLAPAILKIAPVELVDLDVDPASRIEDKELPGPFARLRAYFAEAFGVPPAAVYAKPDLGASIHVAAVEAPALIAGDDALTAPERSELAFRLGRAMTFLWPGRALGASRPARVLKAVVIAMFNEAAGASIASGDERLAAEARGALDVLAFDARTQARGAVLRLVAKQPDLNLSRWARAVARTADRAGLLLAGDLPAALTAVRDAGGDEEALIEFGTGKNHQQLRSALGITVG